MVSQCLRLPRIITMASLRNNERQRMLGRWDDTVFFAAQLAQNHWHYFTDARVLLFPISPPRGLCLPVNYQVVLPPLLLSSHSRITFSIASLSEKNNIRRCSQMAAASACLTRARAIFPLRRPIAYLGSSLLSNPSEMILVCKNIDLCPAWTDDTCTPISPHLSAGRHTLRFCSHESLPSTKRHPTTA